LEDKISFSKGNNVPDQNPREDRYLTTKELQSKLSVSRQTIHNWKKQGLINGYTIGGKILFSLKEIEEAIRNSSIV